MSNLTITKDKQRKIVRDMIEKKARREELERREGDRLQHIEDLKFQREDKEANKILEEQKYLEGKDIIDELNRKKKIQVLAKLKQIDEQQSKQPNNSHILAAFVILIIAIIMGLIVYYLSE